MGKLLVALVVLIILGLAGFTWVTLHWAYSDGERAGYVQKLSRKGWLCKTWEGEMAMVTMPGTVAEKFAFTVPDSTRASASAWRCTTSSTSGFRAPASGIPSIS